MKNIGKFFKSNWAYLISFIVYFSISTLIISAIVQNMVTGILCTSILYGLTITLALSSAGENLWRLQQGAKSVCTSQDRDYVIPIFNEVYERAKAHIKNMRKDIQLYIIESMDINAFAAGRKTIAITRGAIQGLDKEQLKGIIAHEFGHMAHGDTKGVIVYSVGNGFFSIIITVMKTIYNFMQRISHYFRDANLVLKLVYYSFWLGALLFDLIVFLFELIGNIILSLNSRQSEYFADKYAYVICYGENLKNSLCSIREMSIPSKMTLTERLNASHPHIDKRIERLEKLISKG